VSGIDDAVRSAGYPMGPFELMDLVGLDVNLAAAMGIFERSATAGDPLQERFRPSPIQERLVVAGRLGRKTGEGFYEYGPDGRAVRPAAGFVPVDRREPDAAGSEVAERITLAIVNEAYRALGDGVATAADIDLALRLGAGHPTGPFEYVQGAGGPQVILDGLARHAGDGPRFLPAPALLAAAAGS
jgi:3-hydroxybutyryl-CoA dehydrogenase